jgi:hypothetical protein
VAAQPVHMYSPLRPGQDVHQQRELSYEDEEVLSALVSFVEECRVPPTSYVRPISCDCPFYFTLKQAPIWNHSCTGHMELIHQRPTREDWKQHVRARHAPLLKEVLILARRVAERSLLPDPATAAPAASRRKPLAFFLNGEAEQAAPATPPTVLGTGCCPFGCSQAAVDASNGTGQGLGPEVRLRADGTESLADRAVREILGGFRSGSQPLGDASPGVPSSSSSGASAWHKHAAITQHRLLIHLARCHLPELQFMVVYATELAHKVKLLLGLPDSPNPTVSTSSTTPFPCSFTLPYSFSFIHPPFFAGMHPGASCNEGG